MTRNFTLAQILDFVGILGAVVSIVMGIFLARFWSKMKAEGLGALHSEIAGKLTGTGAAAIGPNASRYQAHVRREVDACGLVVMLVSPGKRDEAVRIEALLRRSFARVVEDDADVPANTVVVVVGAERCYAEVAKGRSDLPLVLYSGNEILDRAKLSASERLFIPANTVVTAATQARALAVACAE
jgi:hypothetical protein